MTLPKGLTWDDFRIVKAIADHRTLPAAADALGLNHSTVFRRLRQIEEALGLKLFERHRSGYELTPAGDEMAALAAGMDEGVAAFSRKIAGREIAPSGEVRVTTSDTLLTCLLTPLFARFRQAFPLIRLDIVIANQPLNLSRRDADVAIRATDAPQDNLVGRRIATIGWALYGSADAFAGRPVPPLEALFAHDWISLGDNMASVKAVQFVRQHVAAERIVYRINTVLGLAEAVAEGIGIGHLPVFIGDKNPGLVRLTEPDPQFATDLWLLTHADLRASPRVRVLLDFLAEAIAAERSTVEGVPRGGAE
ncbi:LysR family transcriptional regulator [Acuticoccus sp. M5D2P5]|uniref:LysR family transcriptional regulator n=1 Tax=Acuticoccus kalidii TaxID=2910977 RepID=UPI001F2A47E2|nr:LysR family transcriptional regulator [Acuticoccus kalidii]MCF3936269.1 LysR family transcriptional regulator [Acuticoccus kalidii]